MGWVRWLTALAILAGCAGAANAEGRRELRVRVFDYAGLEAGELARARAEMTRIFGEAGMELVSVECGVGGRGRIGACEAELSEGEMVVRMLGEVKGKAGGVGETALGFAFAGEDGSGGVMASVVAGRTRRLARKAGVEFAWLLGKVMAHEVGHLVMGAGWHAKTGLMRAGWSVREVKERRAEDWQFTEEELMRMRFVEAMREGAGSEMRLRGKEKGEGIAERGARD